MYNTIKAARSGSHEVTLERLRQAKPQNQVAPMQPERWVPSCRANRLTPPVQLRWIRVLSPTLWATKLGLSAELVLPTCTNSEVLDCNKLSDPNNSPSHLLPLKAEFSWQFGVRGLMFLVSTLCLNFVSHSSKLSLSVSLAKNLPRRFFCCVSHLSLFDAVK